MTREMKHSTKNTLSPSTRRMQFALRHLFMVLTLAAVLCWIGIKSYKAREAARQMKCTATMQQGFALFETHEPDEEPVHSGPK